MDILKRAKLAAQVALKLEDSARAELVAATEVAVRVADMAAAAKFIAQQAKQDLAGMVKKIANLEIKLDCAATLALKLEAQRLRLNALAKTELEAQT